MKTPKVLKGKVISMDIGEKNVKVVVGKANKEHLTIYKTFSFQTPEHSIEDGKITNITPLMEKFRDELNTRKIKGGFMNVSYSSTEIIEREIVLPKIKVADLAEMVRYEIQQDLPIDVDKYVIQYKVIEEFQEDERTKLRIVVSAIERKIIESYLALINQLGFKPFRFDIHSNSLDKLMWVLSNQSNSDISVKRVVMLDFGHKLTNMSIFDRGTLKMSQTIHYGGHDLDIAIERLTGQSRKEVVKVKESLRNIHRINAFDEDEKALKQAVQISLNDGISEIQRIIRYFVSRASGNQVDEIYIYGELSKLGGLRNYLEQMLSIPVKTVNDLPNLNSDEEIDLERYINAIGAIVSRA
jgi:type IV pilus assembly protein PilM